MIDKKHFDRAFKGFVAYDAEVVDRSTFAFVLFKDEREDKGGRRLVEYCARDGGSVRGSNYTGFPRPSLAISRHARTRALMIALDGNVAALGDGESGMLAKIPKSPLGPIYAGAMSATSIDGRVHVCGGWRHACFLDEGGQWISIRANLQDPKKGAENDVGFDAIDGFALDDIYAVGRKGDAWRYDGERWHRCPVPTNMLLESVCCAGDGAVYIGMQSGGLMRGRENQWEIIHEDTMTLPFKDMVWFNDRLWCTSDYGLWTVEGGKLIDAEAPPQVKACSGNLSVADGVMLLAGRHGAALYDGKAWDRLF